MGPGAASSPNSAKPVMQQEKDYYLGLQGLSGTTVQQVGPLGPREPCACPVNVLLGHTTEFSFQRLDEQYLAWAETCRVMRSAAICARPLSRLNPHCIFEWASCSQTQQWD